MQYNSFSHAFLKSIKRRRPCRKECPLALNCCSAGSTFPPRKPSGSTVEHKIDQDATGPWFHKGRGLFLMTTRALQQSVMYWSSPEEMYPLRRSSILHCGCLKSSAGVCVKNNRGCSLQQNPFYPPFKVICLC